MSHAEFEVSRRHVFVDSCNLSRSPYNIKDDGKLRLDLDTLGESAQAHDGQFIRVGLTMFSSSNVYDRHLSPSNSFFLYVGSQITPSSTFPNKTLLQQGTLANCTLLSARYENYGSVMLDVANATVQQLSYVYPPADYGYSITRLGGSGPTFGLDSSSTVTALGALGTGSNSAPLEFTPQFPVTLDTLGCYRQSGEKMLTFTIKIQKKNGSFPVIFDNSTDALSLGFVFSNANSTFQTCGATSTPITPDMSYTAAAARMSSGLGVAPDSVTPDALGSFNGRYTFSTTTTVNDTLEILVSCRAPIQLDPSALVYLRLGMSGNSYSTANLSTVNPQDPSVVVPSEILATIPCQKDNLYYVLSGGEPVFTVDYNVRSLHQLNVFLTNEKGGEEWRSNAYSLSYYVTNIAFRCCLRISVMQRAVVASTAEDLYQDDDVPARFVSQPQTHLDNGRNSYLENTTTRLARRGI